MSKLSVGKKTVSYVASAAFLAALIMVASTLYIGLPTPTQPMSSGSASESTLGTTSASISSSESTTFSVSSTSFSAAGPQSLLVVQLTDPPQVPQGTRSLNLTYTSLSLLVGEPSSGGKVNTVSVNSTPAGGSATLDLLKLQNVSQTIASANLPNDSIVYSVTFAVSGIAINVNGVVSQVTLAVGGNSFSVTISQPLPLRGENVALLQLNPIVVGTPTGYQLIPSAVGVIKSAQGQGEEQVGYQHQLTNGDDHYLHNAHGNLTANLAALSVSGTTTTVTVQVSNTDSVDVLLGAIGLHGNFSVSGTSCSSTTSTTTTSTSTRTSTTSTSTTTQRSSSHSETRTSESFQFPCQLFEHMNEVVFVPVAPSTSTTSSSHSTSTTTSSHSTSTTTTTATTSTACTSSQMSLINGNGGNEGDNRGFLLRAGQCVSFTFSGKIALGESGNVLVPSTANGQSYEVDVIGSEGANLQLTCVLPLGANSCRTDTQNWFDFGDFVIPLR
jgi:hypothetical protein